MRVKLFCSMLILILTSTLFLVGCGAMSTSYVRSVKRLKTLEFAAGGNLTKNESSLDGQAYTKCGLFSIIDSGMKVGTGTFGPIILIHTNKESKYIPEVAVGGEKYWGLRAGTFINFLYHTNLIKHINEKTILYIGYKKTYYRNYGVPSLMLSNWDLSSGTEIPISHDNISLIIECGNNFRYKILKRKISIKEDEEIEIDFKKLLPEGFYFGTGVVFYFGSGHNYD